MSCHNRMAAILYAYPIRLCSLTIVAMGIVD